MTSLKGSFSLQKANEIYFDFTDLVYETCNLEKLSIFSIIACGSIRRQQPVVGDIDVLIEPHDIKDVKRIISQIEKKVPIVYGALKKFVTVYMGIPIDVSFTTQNERPFALMHHTGPNSENIRLRALAKRKGYKLNQYGLAYRNGNPVEFTFSDEEDVYRFLGSTYRSPHLR